MDDGLPLAYLITFRSYGTWLHGDERGSVDRFHNQYASPTCPANGARLEQSTRRLKRPPVILDPGQRQAVEHAIRQTCEMRHWALLALNARTNHVHVVVDTAAGPETVLNAFKANATRELREDRLWHESGSPWSGGGSKRYVWTEAGLANAIDYVVNGQRPDSRPETTEPPAVAGGAVEVAVGVGINGTTCGNGWRGWV